MATTTSKLIYVSNLTLTPTIKLRWRSEQIRFKYENEKLLDENE